VSGPLVTLVGARGVSVRFGDTTAVRDATLALHPGEFVGLIGPNGSGKSSLLRALAGVAPHAGTVTRSGPVAFLPQSPTAIDGFTVRQTLMLGRLARLGPFGFESAEDERAVREVAELLGLSDLLGRRLDTLSGGQRQRAFVGRALAQRPAALLLDEPATYLDLRHAVELFGLLRLLSHDQDYGVIASAHDLNLAAGQCDRVVVMRHGTIAADGPPAEVLTAELLTDVFGVPMQRLEVDGRPHFAVGAP